MTRSPRHLLAGAAALAAFTFAAPAQAAPVSIQSGSIDWAQANVYNAAPERTFLGHVTQPGVAQMGRSNGTATPSDGATVVDPEGAPVAAVGPESLRGPNAFFTFEFGSATGTFDPVARTGEVQTTGSLTYVSYPGLGPGAPAPLKISNPRIVLNGLTGAVYAGAEGVSNGRNNPAIPYDPATPLFTLDARHATVTRLDGGAFTIGGLVPTLAKAGVFGSASDYAPGTSGPDRTPNTWGAFALQLDTDAPAPVVPPTVVEKIVEKPVTVEKVVDQKATLVKATLAKQPFSKSAVEVELRKSGSKELLGEGYVVGKKLRVWLPEGTKLAGKYKLTRTSGSKKLKKSSTVTIGAKQSKKSKKSSK